MTHTRFMALALGAVAWSPLMAADLNWQISEASGDVQLLHAGLSKVAVRGGLVTPGDTIVTGRGARAVVTRGEEYLMVAPSSQLRLPAGEQSGTVTKIFQDVGNVVFMIKKKLTPHFQVSTPYLAAVVKGTTFSVSVTDTGTSVQVIEGAVDVATVDGGAHDLLKPGAVAMVAAGDIYRLKVEGDGVARTLTSPALPAHRSAPQPTTPSPSVSAVAHKSMTAENTITATIVEKPVSLADTTNGLVKGTIGGDAQTQFAMASESSRAAVDTIEAATASAKAAQVTRDAEAARAQATAVKADASQAARTAEQATSTADQSAAAAAEAAAAKAASDAAAAQAQAKADQAAKLARAAAADAAQAAEQDAARQAEAVAAIAAQKAAEAAKQSAADATAMEAASKVAEAAAQEAQRASDEAARAEADRIARDVARMEADKQADKAAKDAEKAAKEAVDKAAEMAARDAAKAADDVAREQAKQAADAAKAAEKATKDAADKVAKEAEKAAQDAEKAARDAVKSGDIVEVADSSGRGRDHHGTDDRGNSGKGKGPIDILKDLLDPGGKGKGKN